MRRRSLIRELPEGSGNQVRAQSVKTTEVVLCCGVFVVLTLACAAQGGPPTRKDSTPPAILEIHLRDLGYQTSPEYLYPGNGIPRDLSILNDDYRKRLTFVDDKTLVVYQSHYPPQNPKEGSAESRSMEAFFVSSQTGALISRKTWPTIKRRWLNELWDTQARIIAVQGGFLVHASDSLALYTAGLEPKRKLLLEDGPLWAVTVAPSGRTIHLQRIQDDNQAEGEWLDSDTLAKLHSQHEMAGVTSASDQAVVEKLAHCVQLQTVGEAPRNLYCAEASHLDLPLFLSDSEVLSVGRNGFSVLSTNGEKLWSREAVNDKNSLVSDHKRSLSGNRFALSFRGDRHAVFDQVRLRKGEFGLFVYDRSARMQVFYLNLGRVAEGLDFALSPDGGTLAILVGETVRFYKIPSL
jgi:hypothetical protein